jgi:hypothetical protein
MVHQVATKISTRDDTVAPSTLMIADGIDLRPLPLRERKARFARFGAGAEGWIALTNGVVAERRALFRAVVDADLEGIVAKLLTVAYHPRLARWYKIMNARYTQHRGRAEWFLERGGRNVRRRMESTAISLS